MQKLKSALKNGLFETASSCTTSGIDNQNPDREPQNCGTGKATKGH
jgi:hypothetical protein